MKPKSQLGLFSLCLGLAFASVHAQTAVELHGKLSVQGNHIVDKNGAPVQFRGMALYWSQWKPAFYNAACVKWLRDDWKCNIVRATIAVGSEGYKTNPDKEMAKAKAVVQAAIDLGIYVVVDFHETGNGNDDLSTSKAFFQDLSKTYKDTPNIIYETWNEPLGTHAWNTVIKPYHEAIIPVIRANAPDNLILCGTRTYDQDVDEASKNPITITKNIVYTLHFYAATHKQSLRTKAQTALDNGIALMVTEGGASESSGNGALDTTEMRRWTTFMDKNSISWMNWSVADLTETSAALKPGASGNGNWSASNLSASGTWMRQEIRAHNGSAAGLAGQVKAIRMDKGKLSAAEAMPLFSNGSHVFDLMGQRIKASRPGL
jgi:endoglucanase